jgi:hypothetical protein
VTRRWAIAVFAWLAVLTLAVGVALAPVLRSGPPTPSGAEQEGVPVELPAEVIAPAKALKEQAAGPLELLDVYECYTLYRDRANFGPRWYNPDGSISAWWNHLACVPVPGARPGDKLRVTAQILAASYHSQVSAFEPVMASVHTSATVVYDSSIQRAAYKPTGQLLLPASGENVNNAGGSYVRPHRRSSDVWWHTVQATPVYVHVWMPLSSFSADNATYLDVPSAGGQSSVVVEHYRRRP